MTRALSLLLTGLVALCAGGGVLREARIPAQAEAVRPVPGKALELPSFDGATVTVVVGRRSVSTAGVVTYGGRTSGSWFSNASIVMTGGGGLVATVGMGGSVLSFRLKGGEWTVRETAQAARGGRRCTVKRPPAPAAAGNGRSARLRAGLTGRPTIDGAAYMKRGEVYTNVIDVLVGVDASAARWIRESSDFAGEERALELFAADAIQRSNDVCGNTDLDQLFSFNLAGVVEVGVDCSVFREPYYGIVDLDTILDGLAERRGRGEYLAAYTQVREKRELFCADLVTFFVSGGEEALESMVGLGYSLDDVTIKYADFAEYAYSVCVVEAVAIDTTLAHEMGHNMGAGHGDMIEGYGSGPQLYDYSKGSVFCVTNDDVSLWGCTVMAYNSDGFELFYRYGERWGEAPWNAVDPESWRMGYYVETPFFSSSRHTYKYEWPIMDAAGAPVLDDDGNVKTELKDSGVALGDATHDNTRLLSLSYPVVANYRVRKNVLTVVTPGDVGRSRAAGGGIFEAGKTATLKATSGAGWAFGGWYLAYDEETGTFSQPLSPSDGADFRNPAVKVVFPKDEIARMEVYARFVPSDVDAGSLSVRAADVTAPADGSVSLALGEGVSSMSLPKLALKGLPSGLKYDAKTMTVTGKAAKPGVYVVRVSATNASVKKATDATTVEFRIVVPNFECAALPRLKPETDAYGVVFAGVAFDSSRIDCAPAEGWAVKASGLPAGLKFDAKRQVVTGVPTAKTGMYTVTFTASKKGEKSQVATITLNVQSLPQWAYGTFNGVMRGGTAWPFQGLVSMTVAANGKMSGKLLTDDGAKGVTWALSAPSFASVVQGSENPVFLATAVAKSGKVAVTNEVEVKADAGRGVVNGRSVRSSDGAGDIPGTTGGTGGLPVQAGWTAWQNLWKVEPWKTVARPFSKAKQVTLYVIDDGEAGRYVVDSPPAGIAASGTIALKFASTGAVTANGKFVVGRNEKTGKEIVHAASCSTTLVPSASADTGDYPLAASSRYTVHLYFPPNLKKGFAGFSAEWTVGEIK